MARSAVHDDRLVIEFSAWERPFTGRGRVEVPFGAIRHVQREPHPLQAVRGMRNAGAEVLGLVKVGYWGLGTGGLQLVSVRSGRPAVRIVAEGVGEILVSAPDAVIAALEEVRT